MAGPRETTVIKTLEKIQNKLQENKPGQAMTQTNKLLEKFQGKSQQSKRPPNKYNMFVSEQFEKLKKTNPDMDHQKKMEHAAAQWKKLSEEEKAKYGSS